MCFFQLRETGEKAIETLQKACSVSNLNKIHAIGLILNSEACVDRPFGKRCGPSVRSGLQVASIHAETRVFGKLSLAFEDCEVDLDFDQVGCHVSRGLSQSQVKW